MGTKNLSTHFSMVSRGKGGSAVEKSAYISREKMENEYNGLTYYPKYTEDLVHAEVLIPDNAPEEYSDRSVLWNAVEMYEDRKNAQLARMTKVSLPNDWSYELAIEVMRDYLKRNFVSEGMCVDFAIHDSENDKHQRNLHCHIMLTVRPMDENGKWQEVKDKKVYALDENGERIPVIDEQTGEQKVDSRNRKQWKRIKVSSTGWDSPQNAKKWREDLAKTINETNERIGLDEHWEHRSFKEQGLDIPPTKHLGVKANALEKSGVHTEIGDYNRWALEQRMIIENAKSMLESAKQAVIAETEKLKAAASVKANEVLAMLDKVFKRKGVLALPIVGTKYVAKISNRGDLQNPETVKKIAILNEWDSFDKVRDYKKKKDPEYDRLESAALKDMERLQHLDKVIKAYNEFKPLWDVKMEYGKLNVWEKRKFKKEHKEQLEAYPDAKTKYDDVVGKDKTFRLKEWQKEKADLETKLSEDKKKMTVAASTLAVGEVILYNKKNLEREERNEERNTKEIDYKTRFNHVDVI